MKLVRDILRGAADGRGLRGQLTRGAIGVIALKAASMLLGLASAVVLARALGAEGYGTYSFAFSVAMLLAIPSQVGLPTLVVREVAVAEAKGRWGLIRGLLRWANAGVLAISVAVAGAAAAVVWAVWGRAESVQAETLLWAFALVPLLSLGALRSATLRGLRHVVLAQFPEPPLRRLPQPVPPAPF